MSNIKMFYMKHFENKKSLSYRRYGEKWRKTMNEIMEAKKITGLKNTALKESLLAIRGAVLSVNASQWEVAQAVHDILVKETFKEDFETEEKFADFIGISRSNCNKMKKAVDFRNSNKTFEGWTLNKIYEIMCLPKEEAPQILDDYMIDKDDTVKEIREAVKAYKDDTVESKIVAEVEPSEENGKGVEQKNIEENEENEKNIPMKEDCTKESLLHCYFDTLTKEEIVRVLNYMNKQKIGDSEELKEVIEAWK